MCNAWNHPADCTCGWGGEGHLGRGGGGWGGGGGYVQPVTPPRVYRWEAAEEGFTRPTTCPRCGDSVFFVRHNGGSVWFDDLGPPWPKHGCFDDDHSVTWRSSYSDEGAQGRELGLIKEAQRVDALRVRFTVLLRDRTVTRIVDSADHPESFLGGLVLVDMTGVQPIKVISRRHARPAREDDDVGIVYAILADFHEKYPDGTPVGHVLSAARKRGLPANAVQDALARLASQGRTEQVQIGLWRRIELIIQEEDLRSSAYSFGADAPHPLWVHRGEGFGRQAECEICHAHLTRVHTLDGIAYLTDVAAPWPAHSCYDDLPVLKQLRGLLETDQDLAATEEKVLGIIIESFPTTGSEGGRMIIRLANGSLIDQMWRLIWPVGLLVIAARKTDGSWTLTRANETTPAPSSD